MFIDFLEELRNKNKRDISGFLKNPKEDEGRGC